MGQNHSVSDSTGKTDKLPFHRVLAYASTDTAGNLLYCTVTTFVLYYYTDVFGLSVVAAGLILLVARILDAFDAPIWGFIIDHTHTKWGQNRPYWLWISIPFTLFFVLMFWSPNLSANGKFVYGLITYLLLGICYTGIGTPISSILPNLSNNKDTRVRLNSVRMIGGMAGFFVTATFTLSLVSFLGKGNDVVGFRITTILFALIGLALLLFAFGDTREINAASEKPLPIKQSLRAAKSNWPWFILVVAFVFYWLGNASRTSALVYYTQYNLGNKEFASVLNALILFQIVGMVAIPFVVKHISKTQTLIIGFLLAALGQILINFTGQSEIMLAVSWSVASIGTGVAVSMPFAMLADTVDFGEWKNGIRASGFLTAIGSSFAIKVGQGLGGWVPALIMGSFGYKAGAVQSAATLGSIKFCISWLPALFFIVGAIITMAYTKYEKQETSIKVELNQRRGGLEEA
ncbi:MFS transporter [Sporolactobacillus sp. KGMB 08714]|uniref:MFS transporter n=1 Tax=Sporolactobacillus sp. KGMB 08714 TaxID=3064704 RepID=UPI002FBE016A